MCTNRSNRFMRSYVCRDFSSVRWKMMKEDLGVSKAQAWGCARNPQEIFKETQASKLGDTPCIPFFINNHQFVPRSTIFLSLHALCVMLGASCSLLFLGLFLLCLL